MTELRRPLIAGNWKMNGLSAEAGGLAAAIAAGIARRETGCDVLVCPPATALGAVALAIAGTPLLLGGQDCHEKPAGAYTGDISAPMLRDAGCSHVILGHSERRTLHGESDAKIHAKTEAAGIAGLKAIVCVGETESERAAGETSAILLRQIDGSIPTSFDSAGLVVAYEPVWAIGSGRVPTSEEIVATHELIRSRLAERIAGGAAIRILYGGSVKPENAAAILALPGVDGALVGGASLKADDFLAIVAATPRHA